MLNHAEAAVRYLGASTVADLERDDQKLSAILWRIAIVGEAASSLAKEHGAPVSALPLQAARSMRNLLIHKYPEIDVNVVVQTVREEFPPLIADIEKLLREEPSE